MDSQNTQVLYILAGPNGAGKTTASKGILPDLNCTEFLNADEIACTLCPSNPESVAIEAGRVMLEKIKSCLNNKKTFAIETTLATRSYTRLVNDAKARGYKVVLFFFWLDSPEIATDRVEERVREGGHNIPYDVIHRRYWLGLQNLFQRFMSIVTSWAIYDNNAESELIANSEGMANYHTYQNILRRLSYDQQTRFLEYVGTGQGLVNWQLINDSLQRNYEELLIEKSKKSLPLIVSHFGKPQRVSAPSALKLYWSKIKGKY